MESQIIRLGHLTAHQTARALGISLDGVRQLVRRSKLTRSGGSPRQAWYPAADITALVAKRAATDAA
ncbi:hypothetical protein [Streptomyces rhizosphaerihabitans]|uniref:hypothetical protein n=1 Tax=Streptomyces rhizosphaerihabitans TaxID=1266770 RepID=UPI0021C0B284|nr:hypothetical protein [Streptomyces rhizosphaerihabitans]MCT9010004.1 hypothetical protein [Streptomyces rhizosphaerihabitans]